MKKVYLVLYSEDDQIIDIIAEDNPKKDWRVLRNDYAYLKRAEEHDNLVSTPQGEILYLNFKKIPTTDIDL